MALLEFGPTVIGARGTVGGLTFSANKSGPYMRAWSKGGNPRSPRQTANRNVLTKFSVAWGTLTQVERDDWDDYADDPAQELTNSLGIDYFTSGFAWFVKINSALDQAGAAQRDDAPTLTRLAAPVTPSFAAQATGAASETRIVYGGGDPNQGVRKVVFARVFSSEGRNAASSGFFFMENDTPFGGSSSRFQDPLEETFGTITAGQIIFATTRNQDAQGQRSPLAAVNDVAAA